MISAISRWLGAFFEVPKRSHTVVVTMRNGREVPAVAWGDTLWDAIKDVVAGFVDDDWRSLTIGYKLVYVMSRDEIEKHLAAGTAPVFERWDS